MLTKESKLFKNEGVRLHSTGDFWQFNQSSPQEHLIQLNFNQS